MWTRQKLDKVPPVDSSIAQYTGGEQRVGALHYCSDLCKVHRSAMRVQHERDLSHVGAGTPYPHLAHIAVGVQGVAFTDKDYVALCVLNTLMGGGCHFSSGGPGKGMFTRLFTHVLNQSVLCLACTVVASG